MRRVIAATNTPAEDLGAGDLAHYLRMNGVEEFNAYELRRSGKVPSLRRAGDMNAACTSLVNSGVIAPRDHEDWARGRRLDFIVAHAVRMAPAS